MNEKKNMFHPDYAVPPGATLQETIRHLGLTQKELAQRMGRPLKTINEIIKGVAAITAETALQLEKVVGIPAVFWNNAEAQYRESLARMQEQACLQQQTAWVKLFSYRAMTKLKLIAPVEDAMARVAQLLRYFGVASREEWQNTYQELTGAAREDTKRRSELGDLSAWLRAGEILAQRCNTAPYDREVFKTNLSKIRSLTAKKPHEVWVQVCELCAEAGVVVALVPELPKTHIHGFTRWLTPGKALIQLSCRYKTDDALWFTFFHEAAHILLHGKKDIFMEVSGATDQKEIEANQWAADFLIPSKDWEAFVTPLPKNIGTSTVIKQFAAKQGIATSIVVGRLQHQDKKLHPGRFNELKNRLEINWSGLELIA